MASRFPHGAVRFLAAAAVAVPLLLAPPVPAADTPDDRRPDATSYEQRASAEKTSRTRYRKLEVASAILIIAGGGAVIFWAMRRK